MPRRRGHAELNLGPEVLARIALHKRHNLLLKLAMVGPLLLASLALLGLTIYSAATGSASVTRAFTDANGSLRFLWWVIPLALVVAFLLSAAYGGRQRLRPYDIGTDKSQNVFRNALDGVSSAVGMAPLPLVVLDLPTPNSISFLEGNTPSVGVTVEALVSDLTNCDAEAMMAHEVSHILAGDIYIGSSSRRMRRVAYGLVFALIAVVLLSSFILNVSWVVPFIVVLCVPFYLYWLYKLGRLLNRQNDLLADSIAAKITYNPAALASAIGKVAALYMQNVEAFDHAKRYADYLFISRTRPRVEQQRFDEMKKKLHAEFEPGEEERFDRDFMAKVAKKARFRETTIEERLDNLRAIDLGHWVEFEKQ